MTCGLAIEKMYNFLMRNFESVNDENKFEGGHVQSVIPTVVSDGEDTESQNTVK